jgi:hydroxymethylpyrimidine/phosphomethylpyrimidine kinase
MDQSLDAGFRPGMGSVVPDRFFWAMPPAQDGDAAAGEAPPDDDEPAPEAPEGKTKPAQRRIH